MHPQDERCRVLGLGDKTPDPDLCTDPIYVAWGVSSLMYEIQQLSVSRQTAEENLSGRLETRDVTDDNS